MRSLFLVIICVLLNGSFYSNTIYVTNLNDNGPGSLRNAINLSSNGDIIRLHSNLLSTYGTDTIQLYSTININKSITLKGCYNYTDSIFISGSNSFQIFSIDLTNNTKKSFFIDSLYLINGEGGSKSGAIEFQGDTLKVYHSVLKGNKGSRGGAINCPSYQTPTFLGIHESFILENESYYQGGGICWWGSPSSIIITNSKISNNRTSSQGSEGGGVHIYAKNQKASISIINSIISNNESNAYAGGISAYAEGGSSYITVIRSSILNNTSEYSGGGIYSKTPIINENEYSNNAYVNIYSSTFSGNKSFSIGNGGHAIYVESNNDAICKIYNSTIVNNRVFNTQKKAIVTYSSENSSVIAESSIITLNGNQSIIDEDGSLPLTSQGYNIFDSIPSQYLLTSDQISIDTSELFLSSLVYNSNNTISMIPNQLSIAINKGNPQDNSMAQNGDIVDGIRDVGASEYYCSEIDSLSVHSCGTYTSPSGNYIWNSSGTYHDTVHNFASCDSIFIISLSFYPEYSLSEQIEICSGENYTFPDGNIIENITQNISYTSLLTTDWGCDSIIYSNIIIQNSITPQQVQICKHESYTFPDGNTLENIFSDTIYSSILSSNLGCDSIIETQITIDDSEETHDIQLCSNENYIFPDGNTINNITEDTTYISFLSSNIGCDSIIITNINVHQIDETILNQGGILYAISNANQYQWMDCTNNSIINGENQQSFEPTYSAYYAVILDDGNCIDTTECIYFDESPVGTSYYINNQVGIQVHPNPTKGNLVIDVRNIEKSTFSFEVFDINGSKVHEYNLPYGSSLFNIEDLGLESGVYFGTLINTNNEIVGQQKIMVIE